MSLLRADSIYEVWSFFPAKEFEIQHQTNDRENSPDFETGNNYIVSTKLCVYRFLETIARSTALKKQRHAQMPCTVINTYTKSSLEITP